MGDWQTENSESNKIITTYQDNLYYKRNSQNLQDKSREKDVKVRNTCSVQVDEIIIKKKLNIKSEIFCESVPFRIFTFLSLD